MKKEEILNKIESLFFELNFKEVSMSKIAELLDIKKASLYYYFPSKQELFKDLILKSSLDFNSFFLESLNQGFENFVISYLEYPLKNKNLFSIIDESYCDDSELKNLISKQKLSFEALFLDNISEKF